MLLLKINNHNIPNMLFNKIYINFDILFSCSKKQHNKQTNPHWFHVLQMIT